MKDKFLRCHILIDGLITNQIALLLPVVERTEFGKMFGIDCRRFLSSPTPPPSYSPPPHFSRTFLLTPGVLLCSPTFSLACSTSAPPGKGKESAAMQATLDVLLAFTAAQDLHFRQMIDL